MAILSCYCCCCWVTSVVSNSVWPHRRQPTRLPRPWDSPGKSTGVRCHCLFQVLSYQGKKASTLVENMQASLGSTGCHCWLLVPSRAQVWGLYSIWRMVLKPQVSSESHERLRISHFHFSFLIALEFLIQKVWGGVLECSFQILWWRWHSWSGIPLRESLQQRNPFTDGDRFFS